MSKFKKELEAEKELAMVKGQSWGDYYSDLDIPEGWENVSYGNDALPSFISDKDNIKGCLLYTSPSPRDS